MSTPTEECPLCDGTGMMSEEFECSLCDGSGSVPPDLALGFEENGRRDRIEPEGELAWLFASATWVRLRSGGD